MRDPFGWAYQDRVRRRYRALKRAVRLQGGRERLRQVRRAAARPARQGDTRGRRRPALLFAGAFVLFLVLFLILGR